MPTDASLVTMNREAESSVNEALAEPSAKPGAGAPPHLVHVFPSFGNGGVPIRIANIINHFGNRYRHTIVALDRNLATAKRLRDEIDIACVPWADGAGGYLGELRRFRSALRGLRPDLLLTYNWGAVEWALVNSLAPICRHIHLESGFGPEEADRQLPRRVLFRRLALRRTSRIVVPSRTLVDLATRVWKLDPGRIVHIPNGVDLARFAAAPEPGLVAGFVKARDELIVGTVAPLRREKNLRRLLEAFAEVGEGRAVRLLVVGDGPERAPLESLAGTLGLGDRVVFAGHVDRPEAVLGWMDVFAITSDTEQMPNSLIQAMAAGRAVAAVDAGDVKVILAEENRPFVAPKGDDRRFRELLARLLDEPEIRTALGRANRDRARRDYDQERMFRAYAELFEEQARA